MSSQQLAYEKKLNTARIILRNPAFLKMSLEEQTKIIDNLRGGLTQEDIDTLIKETRLLGRK